MMLSILIFVVIVALDQLVKIWAAAALKGSGIDVVKGIFSLIYVENRGAAFGMMQNAQALFIVLTLVVCGAIIYCMVKEKKKMPIQFRVSLAMILAGAVGNFIDRLALGYVRDMLYFELIDFPVFNVADSFICIGAGILMIYGLFFKKGRMYIDEFGSKPQKAVEADPAADVKENEEG